MVLQINESKKNEFCKVKKYIIVKNKKIKRMVVEFYITLGMQWLWLGILVIFIM